MTRKKRQAARPTEPDIQGEGDRESARRFNEAERAFVDSAQGRAAIDSNAKPADPGTEAVLLEAEVEAGKRAREHDPEEKRDYQKPA